MASPGARSTAKRNLEGASICVATVSITSDLKTKKASYRKRPHSSAAPDTKLSSASTPRVAIPIDHAR